ncbi:MAG: choice-of-anchor D domain-containing protein, partial [Bacteroidales bacterium]|nr:choice-of-anchor D domain-containing protein [Bacteroidales bacterium]
MKKLLILPMLLMLVLASRADNVMTLSTAQGHTSDTLRFSLSLSNTDSPVAMQAMIPLHGQFRYVNGSCVLSSSRSNGHSVTASVLNDTLIIYSYSLSLQSYRGSSGELLSFSLVVGKEPGTYYIPICNAIISTASGTALPLQTMAGSATILAPKVSVSTTSIDYGHIPILSSYTNYISVNNVGTEPLNITGITIDDNTFSYSPAHAVVQPGNSQTFTIDYNPIYKGSITKNLVVNTNAKVGDSVVRVVADPYAVNELRPLNVTGYTDSIVHVELRMNNMDSIVGLQTSIALPSALTYVPGSFVVNGQRSQNHIASAGVVGNTLTLIIANMQNKPLKGGDGVVAQFDVQLHGYGSYYLDLFNTSLADTVGTNAVSATYMGIVEIQSPSMWSDYSLDMGNSPVTQLPISQYTINNYGNAPLIVDRVLFMNPDFEILDSLPIVINNYESKNLNIRYTGIHEGSYSTTMQIYSNDPYNELKNVAVSCNRYEPNAFYMQADSTLAFENTNVYFMLDNYSDITAIQMDFTYPHRYYTLETSDFVMSERAAGHIASAARLNDSTFRVLFLSLQNSRFSGNSGAVGHVVLHPIGILPEDVYSVSITNVLVADQDGTNKLTSLTNTAQWNTYIPTFSLSGSTNNSRCSIDGMGTYRYGEIVTISAVAGQNCEFLHWENGETSIIRTLQLTSDTAVYAYFLQRDTILLNASFCQGTEYNFYGTTLNQAGLYTRDVINGSFDTTYILSLQMNNILYDTIERVIGNNNYYTFNGHILTTSGYYNDTLQSVITGCDSILTLHLQVLPIYTTYISDTICFGTAYNQNGFNVFEVGIYSDTLRAVNGIDSIVYLTLTVMPTYTTTIYDTICQGNSYYFGNNSYTISGIYRDTLQTIYGCDSVIVLNLFVNNTSATTYSHIACDSYTWIDGITYTASNNTATYTTTNAAGCDSVITLNLTINNSTTSIYVVTACDSYTWIDGVTYTENNNTATYNTTNAAGCDSVVTLNLTINRSTTYTDVVTACDSYTWIDGITYTENNNTATYTLTNTAGCDSVITLNLTINRSTTYTDVVTACDSYTWVDGNTYTESNNTATYTTTNAAGCDSVITLNLTINRSTTYIDVITACDSYTWIDGLTYTASNNIATYITTNTSGCDSVITLNLTINYTVNDTIIDTAINEYVWNGTTYTESGMYTYTSETVNGCD